MAAQRPGKLSGINSDFSAAERQSILKGRIQIGLAHIDFVRLVTMRAADFERAFHERRRLCAFVSMPEENLRCV
jgi:hypothetical protein